MSLIVVTDGDLNAEGERKSLVSNHFFSLNSCVLHQQLDSTLNLPGDACRLLVRAQVHLEDLLVLPVAGHSSVGSSGCVSSDSGTSGDRHGRRQLLPPGVPFVLLPPPLLLLGGHGAGGGGLGRVLRVGRVIVQDLRRSGLHLRDPEQVTASGDGGGGQVGGDNLLREARGEETLQA